MTVKNGKLITVSQGNVATHLQYGGNFTKNENLLLHFKVKSL